MPVDEPTEAIVASSLVQLPTPPGSESVVVAPVHTIDVPEITSGAEFTISVMVAGQAVNK